MDASAFLSPDGRGFCSLNPVKFGRAEVGYADSSEQALERSRPALPKLWAMKVGREVAESENYDISSPMR